MTLLDHFNRPLSRTHPWRSLQSCWAMSIVRSLNSDLLPKGFRAFPNIGVDARTETDPLARDIEVHVVTDSSRPQLVAAIEFVNPRHKDRSQGLEPFLAKCAELLKQGIGVIVVDTVTTSRICLDAYLMARFCIDVGPYEPDLAAISYRVVGGASNEPIIHGRQETLAIGKPLPSLPLWIAADLSVLLDLDASYRATCADLRIQIDR